MASGAEVKQSLESSATTYTGGIEARTIDSSTPEIYYSAITSKKPATLAAVRRSALSAVDATASLATYTGIDIGNSIHLALSCRFSVASQSATVFFALYDAAGTVIGTTRDYSFVGDATYTDGTLYVSASEIIDIHAAALVYPILRTAPASGTVSIYFEAL